MLRSGLEEAKSIADSSRFNTGCRHPVTRPKRPEKVIPTFFVSAPCRFARLAFQAATRFRYVTFTRFESNR